MKTHGRAQFHLTEMTEAGVYSAAKGRRFALTVAGAFAVFAGISYWRGRETVPLVLGGLALLLTLAGLAVPSRLGPLERGWMKLAHLISRVTTPIFMGIVYFLLLTPLGAFRRAIGKNALTHKAGVAGYWIVRTRDDAGRGRQRMERQF